MKPASHETENLFATFASRSRCFRRGDVFLTGMVLAVLFAFSTPSFADESSEIPTAIDDVVAGDEGWIIAIDDVAADAGGWITAVDDVSDNGGITAYGVGTDNGGFAAFGEINDLDDGIAAFGEVEDEINDLGDALENSSQNILGFTVVAHGIIEINDVVDIVDEIDAEIVTEQDGVKNCYLEDKYTVRCEKDEKYGAITARGKHYSGDGSNTAVFVSHSGSDTDDFLFLINEVEKMDNVWNGIDGVYAGDENVSIISRNGSEIVARNNGIASEHSGSGRIDIRIQDSKVVSEEGDAISILHRGTGHIEALISGEVRGENAGISANLINNGDGGIHIWALSGSKISGSTGVEAHIDDFSQDGYFNESPRIVYVDVSGTVSGDEIAVNMSGGYYNQLVLRPGSVLNGAAVANSDSSYNYLTLTSAKNGEGLLDLSKYEFRGFNNINTIDGKFTLTGTASEDEAFETIVHGKLRLSDVDYRVRDQGRFTIRGDNNFGLNEIAKRGTLEIEGDNILRGRTINNGDIVFVSAGNTDTLRITGSYDSRPFYLDEDKDKDILPEVIFKIGPYAWDNDKLVIEDNYLRSKHRTKVSVDAPDGISGSFPEESPVLIEVHRYIGGYPHHLEGAFYGDQTIGAYDYVLEYKASGKKLSIDKHYRDKIIAIDNKIRVYDAKIENRKAEIDTRLKEIVVELIEVEKELEKFRSISSQSSGWNSENYYKEREIENKKWALQDEERDLERDDTLDDLEDEKRKLFDERRKLRYHDWDNAYEDSEEPEGIHMWYFRQKGLSGFAANVSNETGDVAENIATGPDENETIEVDIEHSLRASGAPNNRFRVGLDIPAMSFMGGGLVVGTSLMQGFSTSSIDEVAGMSNSIGLGYDFDVLSFSVSPQMELSWTRIDFDDFVGPNNEIVSLEDGDIVMGRLGLLFDGDHIYGGVNLRTALDGRTAVSVSGTSIASEQDDLSVDGLLGFSYGWSEDYETYGELFMNADEVRANLGVRVDF